MLCLQAGGDVDYTGKTVSPSSMAGQWMAAALVRVDRATHPWLPLYPRRSSRLVACIWGGFIKFLGLYRGADRSVPATSRNTGTDLRMNRPPALGQQDKFHMLECGGGALKLQKVALQPH